jgi:biopolymer transport protein ExbD
MSSVFKRGPAALEANLTPMIDVTFLLIIFFVLVSQVVEVENVRMDLPKPKDAATVLPGDEQRAVLNVVPGPGGRARAYRLGGRTFPAGDAGVKALTDQLTSVFAESPQITVNLRADRGTRYEFVEPVMQAISSASSAASARSGSPVDARVNLVVVRDE